MSVIERTLTQRVQALELESRLLREELQALREGVWGWKSPTEAAPLLGCSASQIRRWIRLKESRKYVSIAIAQGTHWRRVGNRYLVNVARWREALEAD